MGRNNSPKAWATAWERGEQLTAEEGKQARCYRARRIDDDSDAWPFVLKELRRQDDVDRRRRQAIEMGTLEKLDHPALGRTDIQIVWLSIAASQAKPM